MKKWVVVSTILTIPMFLEDLGLFLIGRYTELPIWIVMLGIAVLGLMFGGLTRMRRMKKFLGE